MRVLGFMGQSKTSFATVLSCLLLAIVGAKAIKPLTRQKEMRLYLLNNTETSGAVCLDGSPAGFYFSPATNEESKNDWQIYFEGGEFLSTTSFPMHC